MAYTILKVTNIDKDKDRVEVEPVSNCYHRFHLIDLKHFYGAPLNIGDKFVYEYQAIYNKETRRWIFDPIRAYKDKDRLIEHTERRIIELRKNAYELSLLLE